MKKLLASILVLGLLITAAPALAANINVDLAEDGYYFHGPFAGAQMWIDDEISFRDHPAFDAQGYLKFNIAGDLAGVTAGDVTTATMTFSTYHVNEDIPNMTWKSPANGTSVNLDMSPYATAVDMNATVQPDTVAGANVGLSHTVYDIAGAADGTFLEVISMDITSIVKSWLDGSYANNGIKMDILGAAPGEKFYMRAFSLEDGTNFATLNVETSAVPIPGAAWLLGSGLLGLVGIRRRKK